MSLSAMGPLRINGDANGYVMGVSRDGVGLGCALCMEHMGKKAAGHTLCYYAISTGLVTRRHELGRDGSITDV